MYTAFKINRLKPSILTAFLLLIAWAPLSTYANDAGNSSLITSLSFAAADWCPYSCRDANYPGFVTEAMRHALTKYDITLSVTILPWTRAIKMTEQGKFDALLTAIPTEAPGFHLTEKPSGQYQICLFSLPDSSFTYKDRISFKGLVLGAIQDYGYGKPIDDMIKRPLPDEQVYSLSSSDPLHSLVEMAHKNRIDTFVEDRFVVKNYLKKNNHRQLKNSGCLEAVPFFTAISPSYKNHKEAIILLNKVLNSDDYKLRYAQAQQRYSPQSKATLN
jgi:polar amino acid transport system substrate-binding protein